MLSAFSKIPEKQKQPPCLLYLEYNFNLFRTQHLLSIQRLRDSQVTFCGAKGHLLWGILVSKVTFDGGKRHLLWAISPKGHLLWGQREVQQVTDLQPVAKYFKEV